MGLGWTLDLGWTLGLGLTLGPGWTLGLGLTLGLDGHWLLMDISTSLRIIQYVVPSSIMLTGFRRLILWIHSMKKDI